MYVNTWQRWHHVRVFERCHQGVVRKEGGRRGRDGGKIKWTLSEVNTRPMSRGQNELMAACKMAVTDVIDMGRRL